MDLLRIVLIVVAVLLLFGGLSGHFGLWGAGPAYSPYYGGGIGLGTILLVIVIIWILF
jgi:hypothetical protein